MKSILLFLALTLLLLQINTIKRTKKQYYYFDSTPYYYFPDTTYYYTYYPSDYSYYTYSYYPYYFYDYYTPSGWFYWRNSSGKEEKISGKEQPKLTKEDITKEGDALKKEIWGQEKFDTTQWRKNNKVYDAEWLVYELKLARVLELEDIINKTKDNNSSNNERKQILSQKAKELIKEIQALEN